ncbi:unnamed protein product [Pleuronectes platessa]|uniref:Uncharacterized protein n=1 Tax=Pleuronectes platessa TaxID=8262 RepID=A0A9N7YZM2_PLEPL|nr:unnamed protein product [Pleuronectes platessa]
MKGGAVVPHSKKASGSNPPPVGSSCESTTLDTLAPSHSPKTGRCKCEGNGCLSLYVNPGNMSRGVSRFLPGPPDPQRITRLHNGRRRSSRRVRVNLVVSQVSRSNKDRERFRSPERNRKGAHCCEQLAALSESREEGTGEIRQDSSPSGEFVELEKQQIEALKHLRHNM